MRSSKLSKEWATPRRVTQHLVGVLGGLRSDLQENRPPSPREKGMKQKEAEMPRVWFEDSRKWWEIAVNAL